MTAVEAGVRRLVVNPYVRVVFCGKDEILIKHGGRSRYSQILTDEGRTGLIGKVLRDFAEPATVNGLGAEAAELVDYLAERQVLIDPDAYLPHAYLRMHFGDHATAVTQCRIGVVGAGPLGSKVALELSRLRPKAVNVLDDRTVEPHEPGGLDWAPGDAVAGRPYAAVLEAELTRRGCQEVTATDAAPDDEPALTELFARSDVVVLALESYSPQALHAVNGVALAMGKPWMSVFSDGSQAFVGPIYVPGETPCYAEFEIQQEATIALRDDYLVYKETVVREGWTSPAPLLTPYLSIMSGWAVVGLLNFLLGGKPYAVARCVWIDFERLTIDSQDVLKLPRCPACLQQEAGYPRHMFL